MSQPESDTSFTSIDDAGRSAMPTCQDFISRRAPSELLRARAPLTISRREQISHAGRMFVVSLKCSTNQNLPESFQVPFSSASNGFNVRISLAQHIRDGE
jgi:hypothetical protein